MKYCLRYTNICKNLKNVEEISIRYIEDRGLVDFMEKYSGKRIVLMVDPLKFPDSEIRKLAAIKKVYPHYDFAVAMNVYSPGLMATLQSIDIPYFLATPCHSWEELYELVVKQKVSDVNLSGGLAFELPKVKSFLDSQDRKVNIRITPNIISSEKEDTDKLIQFYIRPDDIDTYAPYIDVLEFEGLEHQDTFYNIYAKQKTFIGKLNQVIYNFSEPIDNIGLTTAFGRRRLDCGRNCLKGGHCHRCYTLANISNKVSPLMKKQIVKNIEEQTKQKSNEIE